MKELVNDYGNHFPKITLVHTKAGHHSPATEPSVEGGMASTMLKCTCFGGVE
jgi:hypothetical protein